MPDRIRDIAIEEEMKDSYLTYAMSVIVRRALPDIRDGLKPSQRRILVAMNDLNLGPTAKFRKSAKIVGDTTGNYHPHGDKAVYDTLVRMAQDFTYRYPLVDPQGNFGSIDGDPAAAMRYTEARLARPAMSLLEDLEYQTVDFIPNYDETRQEPTVLPGPFPNLLVNGSAGIAVGMATSIPPHNISEICDAICMVLDKPDVTVADLTEVVKGPDFPTGGVILGRSGIVRGYTTGRGTIVVRARTRYETTKSGKVQIVVDEIPYLVNRENLIDSIVRAVEDGKVSGVSDIRNESDREGSRLVVELKRGENEEVVLNQLYRYTSLQTTFSIINIALVNNRPETLTLKQMIELFIDHRREVIRRRTRFLLNKAEQRAHILEGLLIALRDIDAVIALIRRSADIAEARAGLMREFGLTEVQANAILEMRLQRLTGLERQKVEEEYNQLLASIQEYQAILSDPRMVDDMIREDTIEIKRRFGDARRTTILEQEADLDIEDLVPNEKVVIAITHRGYIKRVPLGEYRQQRRGGKGVIGADTRDEDFIQQVFVAQNHDIVLFFTDKGRVYRLKAYQIPELGRQSAGRALVNLLELDQDERVTSVIPVGDLSTGFIVMATMRGIVKKTSLRAFRNIRRSGIIAIELRDGDRLVDVETTTGQNHVMLVSARGKAICFRESDLRDTGRGAMGVRGIRLRDGDRLASLVIVEKGTFLLTICERGYGKRTPFDEYSVQKRGGYGVIDIRTNGRNGEVVASMAVRDEQDVIIMTESGKIIRTPASDIRITGRATKGVRIMALGEGDRVVAASPASSQSKDEEDVEGALPDGESDTPSDARSSDDGPALPAAKDAGSPESAESEQTGA